MVVTWELGPGQTLHLENRGDQTIATLTSHSAGQQQQASTSIQTGQWTSMPEVTQTATGVVVRLATPGGDRFLQIQGHHISVSASAPAASSQRPVQPTAANSTPTPAPMPPMQPIQPMPPMAPLPPMTMGNMHMSLNPMEMRMGDMELRMGSTAASSPPASPAERRFCSQCGAAVQPSDRFCSHCGHALT